ncbi:baseplate assembly protein [Salinisphaera orenii]|uniref:Baseplate assembly protein n=1 Tax=Salinisphaera orenii YIM 95161 TaxID=1051139 RepID=A0A423PQH8_9GAMM|nr:baseplate J/gp47 family protein [Salinisphaera halophila]ROO27876.1 baseplate assembly protein [Salinisphaera halophila YIM 95161]
MATIDISQLPAPDAVEDLSYADILAERKAALIALYPADAQDEIAATLELESEPLVKQLEENAERELILRQRINEAALAVMLPYATGDDLDNIAARYDVARLITREQDLEADPPITREYETNSAFRERILLSLDGLSTAGPEAAYIFHARSASGQVLDAAAEAPRFEVVDRDADAGTMTLAVLDDAGLDDPQPGDIAISVLSRDGDGTADAALIEAVQTALSAEDVRPLNDNPRVRSAAIQPYEINATLYVFAGPDSELIVEEARAKAREYADTQHRLGYDVTLSGVYAALHRPGVQRVDLHNPVETWTINRQQAPYCTAINIDYGGIDE